jgi:hypothetical protein
LELKILVVIVILKQFVVQYATPELVVKFVVIKLVKFVVVDSYYDVFILFVFLLLIFIIVLCRTFEDSLEDGRDLLEWDT